MCKVRKVGFEGADPTFATSPPRVTFTFGEFCNRFSGGNASPQSTGSKTRAGAKDYVAGGCIRSLRDARFNGLMPRPKATDTKIGLYCPFLVGGPKQAQLTRSARVPSRTGMIFLT